MDSAAGPHVGILSMQTQAARKQWRVVAEGSARDRLSVDGPIEHSRVNGSTRSRPHSGLHRENSRNGRMFHSGGSGSSSDSDHHTGDVGVQHGNLPAQDLGRQAIIQGDDSNIYDEIERLHHQAHLGSTLSGSSIESGVNSSSINADEALQQRLHEVIRQREQLQQIEVDLRAQFIARGEVIRLQNSIDEQVKQQANVVANLQDQLHERELRINHLEQQLEERERELHANKREANEAVNQVWAKDGLLREQTSELAALRRERENVLAEQKATLSQFEAERAQLLSQLQDLKEQLREKEHQAQDLDEQYRSTQNALIYKDEQLREAQVWMQRIQELDAFHANAHSSLHAELRDRNDQIHQLWLGHQRQLADVERYHAQSIQRLQLDLADVREQNRLLKNGGTPNQAKSKEEQLAHSNGKDVGRVSVADQAVGSATNLSTSGLRIANNQVEHASVLPVAASPVLSVAPILPSASLPVLQQISGQPQGMASSIQGAAAGPSQITQTSLSQFSNSGIVQSQQQQPTMHQQAIQHNSKQVQQPQPSQIPRYPHRQQVPALAQGAKPPNPVHPRGSDLQQQKPEHERDQVGLDQGGSLRDDALHLSQPPDVPAIQHPSIQLPVQHQLQTGGHVSNHESSQLPEHKIGDSLQVQIVPEEKQEQELQQQQVQMQQDTPAKLQHEQNEQGKVDKVMLLPRNLDLKAESMHCQISRSNPGEQIMNGLRASESQLIANVDISSKHGSSSQGLQNLVQASVQKPIVAEEGSQTSEPVLQDERSLLACLVRAIPLEPSARIKISTTLPNRLGKMLAPLHWHDYKKQYGRLDEFVSSHPELFVIDGDFIHLREGAHAIISATTTVAKVAAAAAAASPLGASWSPTVVVTPVAQSQMQRLRKVVIAAPVDVKPVAAPVQAMNFHQGGLFAEAQGNGNSPLSEGAIIRTTAVENNMIQNQLGSGASKSSGQRVMMVLGSRSDGLSVVANNVNGLDFEKAVTNSNGNPDVVNRKNGTLFGGRQSARITGLKNGPFGKQDFISRPQTQENKMSRSSSSNTPP